jgi:3' terminal RNA ribose 2'-O-methyltransferase Hen1
MLLTVTYNGVDTENLGYLLHKNPYRAQSFELSFGKAYVFYPQVTNECTTAALLLDINPIDLARGKLGASTGGLFDYVNDRPYVASSFMSTALNRVFGTAMLGRCDRYPELADTPIDLTARIHTLPYRGDPTFLTAVFEPLGYTVSFERKVLDEKFPEWGDSAYIDLMLHGNVKLCDLLNHLYVLIPVFDKQKHYYVGDEEVEKLLRHGSGWLETHPARNQIVGRYFDLRKSYARKAIDLLSESDAESMDRATDEDPAMIENDYRAPSEKRVSLNTQRLEAVKNALLTSGA